MHDSLMANILVYLVVGWALTTFTWGYLQAPTPQAKDALMSKWLDLVKNLAPFILATVPGIPAVLVPAIEHGISVAEQIPGATGAQKKAIVVDLVSTGIQTANSVAGKEVIDPIVTAAAVSSGIDATVNAVNAVHSATTPKA